MCRIICSGTIDGNNQLIIKGKFNGAQIETVLRAYISKLIFHILFDTRILIRT